MADNVKRSQLKTFLNTTPTGESETYHLLGDGVTTGTINYNPEVTTETYIHEDSATTLIERYAPNFPVEARAKKGDKVFDYIDGLRKSRATGSDAETDIVNVWLYETPTGGEYPAEQQIVSIAVDTFGGDGGTTAQLNYTINFVGDPILGTFDPVDKVFTPAVSE